MSFALALFVVLGFATTIALLGLPGRARAAVADSLECLEVLRDPELPDERKEALLRRLAARLGISALVLVGGSLVAIGLPVGAVWIVGRLGVSSLPDVLSVLERPYFLIGTAVGGLVGWWAVRRLR